MAPDQGARADANRSDAGEMVHYRSLVIERFGWWVRLYLGGTSKPDRSRWWRSDLSRGAYLRLRGEQVIGVQWRRSVSLNGGRSS